MAERVHELRRQAKRIFKQKRLIQRLGRRPQEKYGNNQNLRRDKKVWYRAMFKLYALHCKRNLKAKSENAKQGGHQIDRPAFA
jgi:hypothetical protein